MRYRVIILLLLFVSSAGAQTLAPPTAEFSTRPGKMSRGSFQIQNNALIPVGFTTEPYMVTFDKQGPHYEPVGAGTIVEVSASGGRLGPKEIRRVDYRISCSQLPCTIAVKSGLVTGQTKNGMQVRIILTHFVYLTSSKHPRHDILTSAGLLQTK